MCYHYLYLLQYCYIGETKDDPRLIFNVRGLNDDDQERNMILIQEIFWQLLTKQDMTVMDVQSGKPHKTIQKSEINS